MNETNNGNDGGLVAVGGVASRKQVFISRLTDTTQMAHFRFIKADGTWPESFHRMPVKVARQEIALGMVEDISAQRGY